MVTGTSSDDDECGESREKPCFDNPHDEASYWKQVAEEYIQKLQDVRDEFDEFQEGSRELEAELEKQLEQYEKRVAELVNTRSRLEEENEILKEKLETIERKTYIEISELQDENVQVKAVRDEMAKYIRELEQCNDDLERSKRATICSLEEFDVRLNNAIERNAFLENELEEKEQLIITVQRLKEESRDLKGELAATMEERKSSLTESKLRLEETQTNSLENISAENKNLRSPKKLDTSFEYSRSRSDPAGGGNMKSPTSSISSVQSTGNGNTIPPSARISALNIVSDLLRKVGALETKLAKCRNFVQDHPQSSKPMVQDEAASTDPPMVNGQAHRKAISSIVKTNV